MQGRACGATKVHRRVRRAPHGGKTGARPLCPPSRVGKPPGATKCGRAMVRTLHAFHPFSPADLEGLPHRRAGPITLNDGTQWIVPENASRNMPELARNPVPIFESRYLLA